VGDDQQHRGDPERRVDTGGQPVATGGGAGPERHERDHEDHRDDADLDRRTDREQVEDPEAAVRVRDRGHDVRDGDPHDGDAEPAMERDAELHPEHPRQAAHPGHDHDDRDHEHRGEEARPRGERDGLGELGRAGRDHQGHDRHEHHQGEDHDPRPTLLAHGAEARRVPDGAGAVRWRCDLFVTEGAP
jgi:hypothetical protein